MLPNDVFFFKSRIAVVKILTWKKKFNEVLFIWRTFVWWNNFTTIFVKEAFGEVN